MIKRKNDCSQLKYILCCLIFLTLALNGCISYNKTQVDEKDERFCTQETVSTFSTEEIQAAQIEEENLIEETDNYIYDLSIPVIKDFENTKLQENFNNEIQKDVSGFIMELKEAAKDLVTHQYTLESRYEVNNIDKGILSICINYMIYLGGAHGIEYKICYNYDIQSGEKLALNDLFDKEEDYVTIINKEIERQVKEINEEQGYSVIEQFETISEEQNFYIKDGQLVIYFDLYEIAPYVAGILEFYIPKEIFSLS